MVTEVAHLAMPFILDKFILPKLLGDIMHTISTGAKVNKLACFLPIKLVLNFNWHQNYLIVLRI